MKFVVFVLALVVLLWLLKRSLGPRAPRAPRRPQASGDATPLPMATCAVCGLHLPRHEALPGRGGVFCGEAHRAEYERQHPPA